MDFFVSKLTRSTMIEDDFIYSFSATITLLVVASISFTYTGFSFETPIPRLWPTVKL